MKEDDLLKKIMNILIDQLQFTATEEIPFVNDVSNHTYNLGYNHPVKELIWVVRDENYRAVKGIGEKMVGLIWL